MADLFQSALELCQKLAQDPTQQTHALLGGILLALSTLLVRRKRPDRVKVTIDAPKGESVRVKIGDPPPLI